MSVYLAALQIKTCYMYMYSIFKLSVDTCTKKGVCQRCPPDPSLAEGSSSFLSCSAIVATCKNPLCNLCAYFMRKENRLRLFAEGCFCCRCCWCWLIREHLKTVLWAYHIPQQQIRAVIYRMRYMRLNGTWVLSMYV